MSLNDAKNVAREARQWISGSQHRKFGPPGPPHREQVCDSIRTYMVCKGYLGSEQKMATMHPNNTLLQARESFGRPMRQQKILDEEGYELDTSSPLWRFSRDCNLSILFAYSQAKNIEDTLNATKAVAGITANATAAVVTDTVNTTAAVVNDTVNATAAAIGDAVNSKAAGVSDDSNGSDRDRHGGNDS